MLEAAVIFGFLYALLPSLELLCLLLEDILDDLEDPGLDCGLRRIKSTPISPGLNVCLLQDVFNILVLNLALFECRTRCIPNSWIV